MKKRFQKYPFFIFLLPLFLVLHIEKEFYPVINFSHVIQEILILFFVPFLFLFIAWFTTRSWRKAAVITFLLLLPFYFLGEVKDWLKQETDSGFIQRYIFIFPVCTIAILTLWIIIARSKSSFNRFFLFANTLLSIIVILDAAFLIVNVIKSRRDQDHAASSSYQPCKNCEKPDIYFLVFDSYSSSRLLKDQFNFDNHALDSDLQALGFRIIQNSRSNYNLTPFSIASTFNMEYLPGIDTNQVYHLRNFLPAVRMVYDNALLQILKKEGYEIHNHSIFDLKDNPTDGERFDIWDTRGLFRQHNLYKKIDKEIGWHLPLWLRGRQENKLKIYGDMRDKHDRLAYLNILKSIRAKSPTPKFVYGHLFLPHSPYTFDSTGRKIQPISYLKPEVDKKAYLQQIIYTNRLIKNIVDSLNSNGRPKIVILLGDHGYRFFNNDLNQLEFQNYMAVYFPDRDYQLLDDTMTNVNIFNTVINGHFKQKYPKQENQTYFLKYR